MSVKTHAEAIRVTSKMLTSLPTSWRTTMCAHRPCRALSHKTPRFSAHPLRKGSRFPNGDQGELSEDVRNWQNVRHLTALLSLIGHLRVNPAQPFCRNKICEFAICTYIQPYCIRYIYMYVYAYCLYLAYYIYIAYLSYYPYFVYFAHIAYMCIKCICGLM